MGQGLHTKVCQVAATVLGIPTDAVFVAETSTDKVPNASPSAASASSDLYGMAVLLAAKELDARLQPVRAKLGADATFAAVVESAYFQQIDLCAHGFYKTPVRFHRSTTHIIVQHCIALVRGRKAAPKLCLQRRIFSWTGMQRKTESRSCPSTISAMGPRCQRLKSIV